MTSITSFGNGGTVFSGRSAVEVYRATALASGLRLYAKSGIKPNRMWTPKNMMDTAAAITGTKFKARDYIAAADALVKWADAQVKAMDTEKDYDTRVRAYEAKGMTRSDAQGVVDAEDMQ